MELVIDKANVLSFLSHKDNVEIFECTRLIKRGIQLCFNFNKDDITPSSSDGNKIMMWLRTMTQGCKTKLPKWEPRIDSSNLKTNFSTYLTPKQKRDAYLLDNNDVVPKIQEKGAILIGRVGQEIQLIQSLNLEDTEMSTLKISSWADYCPKLPLTDIIICDNHFFKDKYVYDQNKDELIKGLSQLPNNSPVNCIIIVRIGEIDCEIDLEEEAKNIKKSLKNITGSSKSGVTIIGTYSTHDRNAITNYYRLKNGSCFHLKNKGLKEDVTAEIKTHANITNEERTNQLIEVYQKIINNANGKNIYGDKISNFLNFPD